MTRLFKKSFNILNIIKRYNHNFETNNLIKNQYLKINDEINDAIDNNKPLVALESTIITHGLPYPNNYETALEVEQIIRNEGGIPATIAFLNGKIRVGLNKNEIEQVAKSSINNSALKLSRRDLSYVLSLKSKTNIIGGTTVSGTMIAAEAANIPIFVTGGIGGVHRDVNDTLDISADLIELSKTRVAVLSSGIKSILDISKTLEYLETFGVCVSTLDESGSNEFPAFFTSKSGFYAPYNLRSIDDAARLIDTHLKSGFKTGLLIGVPIPEKYSINPQYIENVINESLENAKKLNIKGKAITPYLLEKINKLTKGKSLASNIELIKNNAKIGAKIAKQLAKLNTKENTQPQPSVFSECGDHQVTLLGGVNIDFAFKLKDDKTMKFKGVTQPCIFHQCLGGVARNMTETLIRFGLNKSILLSAISNDLIGNFVIDKSKSIGVDTSKWLILDHVKQSSTGSYCSLFDTHGELLLGLGAMTAHDYILPKFVEQHDDLINKSSICIIDADLPVETLKYVTNKCYNLNIPIWYNPTDLRKCMRIINAKTLSKVTFISPNSKELVTLFSNLFSNYKELDDRIDENVLKSRLSECELKNLNNLLEKYKNNIDNIDDNDLKLILKFLLIYVPFIFLSRGSNDLILASAIKLDLNKPKQLPLKNSFNKEKLNEWSPELNYFPVIKLDSNENIINVSGAGDNTSAGIIAGMVKNYDLISSIYNGLLAAKCALLTHENVSPLVSKICLKSIQSVVKQYSQNVKTERL